ncbi:MAG: S-ribosylhomocysteine lyase [Succinivibrionaceae bacterium]
MPLLDSFKVNHEIMKAPAVRLAKVMTTPKGDTISVYDLRFCKPNHEMLPPKGMHTFEHLFASLMRKFLNSESCEIIDISPMGCRTGFYMSVIGKPSDVDVQQAFLNSCNEIANNNLRIPEANRYQCGSCEYHSIQEAIEIARVIVTKGVSINLNEDILLSDNFFGENND